MGFHYQETHQAANLVAVHDEAEIRLKAILNKSAKEAFEFTINPENTPKWVEGVIIEETSESPTKIGTVYRNQGIDGTWAEFEITAFKQGVMFEMTKKDDNHHVRYTFNEIDESSCELEYYVWVNGGELSTRFAEPNLKKIVSDLKQMAQACRTSRNTRTGSERPSN